jgi:hypothetical protein
MILRKAEGKVVRVATEEAAACVGGNDDVGDGGLPGTVGCATWVSPEKRGPPAG